MCKSTDFRNRQTHSMQISHFKSTFDDRWVESISLRMNRISNKRKQCETIVLLIVNCDEWMMNQEDESWNSFVMSQRICVSVFRGSCASLKIKHLLLFRWTWNPFYVLRSWGSGVTKWIDLDGMCFINLLVFVETSRREMEEKDNSWSWFFLTLDCLSILKILY